MNASPQPFDLREIAPQPWKNGAGLTREIAFGGASRADFDWRISVADVARDGPFSAFADVERCIVLLRGAGMQLRSADGTVEHALTTRLTPFSFAGDVALTATLVGGASSDFNVMTRRGVFRGEVDCVRDALQCEGGDVTLLLCSDGHWKVTSAEPVSPLAPLQGLLWRTPGASPRVEPIGDGCALLLVRLCHDDRR